MCSNEGIGPHHQHEYNMSTKEQIVVESRHTTTSHGLRRRVDQ